MKLCRISSWLLALALTSLPLSADRLQTLDALCQKQAAPGEPPCHLQPCPCDPGEVTLKQNDTGHCACRSVLPERQQTRLKAVASCDKYRQNKRQSCFVSRGNCPRGFEALESFTDLQGNRFSACRDNRHEQTGRALRQPHRPLDQDLLSQYKSLISWLESNALGQPAELPEQTRRKLLDSFPGNSTQHLSLIRTQALSRGCFTDCERIFCANDGQIERWTHPQQPHISHALLHQVVHAVHCEMEGGQESFVRRWFQHLPDEIHRRLQANLPLDAEQIHLAMYMETHANHRASTLCRRLSGCYTRQAE